MALRDVTEAAPLTEPLNETEAFLLERLVRRDQEVAERYIRPLQEQFRDFTLAVEHRLGLPEGAIGTTHQLGPDGVTAFPTRGADGAGAD